MGALLGALVTVGLMGLFFVPLWVLVVWVPAGGCRCRDASRYYGGRRILNPSCPQHGRNHVR